MVCEFCDEIFGSDMELSEVQDLHIGSARCFLPYYCSVVVSVICFEVNENTKIGKGLGFIAPCSCVAVIVMAR